MSAKKKRSRKKKGPVNRPNRLPAANLDAGTDLCRVEAWPIELVTPCATNPRKNDQAVDAVAKSLAAFGWQQPIVVNGAGEILAGHTRWKAAKKLGLLQVPVIVSELDEGKARAFRIADNRTHELSEWDFELLPAEVEALKQFDVDLSVLGFDEKFLAELLGTNGGASAADSGKEIPQVRAVVVECDDDAAQRELFERMEGESRSCRLVSVVGGERELVEKSPLPEDWEPEGQVVRVRHESKVDRSFRVEQVRGMFDLPPAEKSVVEIVGAVAPKDEAWSIGLIVGASGTGKSSVAGEAYAKQLYQPGGAKRWPKGKAVIDCFPQDLEVAEIAEVLTAVGFSSPPAWLRPYAVLSGGERFRCDLARAVLEPSADGLVVFDEYTSVVDRTVAKVCSLALSKAIRKGRIDRRFVAVTCHYDVEEWLQPDWTLDMATGELRRGLVRRSSIELDVVPCAGAAWGLFRRHHYLNHELNRNAKCYVAFWGDVPTAFCAILPSFGHKGVWRITRLVVLPDFQGVGIGGRLLDAVARQYWLDGKRVTITSSHPAMMAALTRSRKWALHSFARYESQQRGHCSAGRAVASFEYLRAETSKPTKGAA